MTSDLPTLASLEFVPYVSDRGLVPDHYQSRVGVYAIFDAGQVLQHIGYSRDVYLSLKQHLVRQPQACHWLKVQTIERPSRTVLEEMKDAWIAENGCVPVGNGPEEGLWTQPIDVKTRMTEAEQSQLATAIDELAQIKVLKQVARRVEAEVLQGLRDRGIAEEIRFNPKMKEAGLLDLK